MLANSLLMRFSSSSLARAFLRSAMNETSPVQICKLPSLASRGHAVMYLASWARCPTVPG